MNNMESPLTQDELKIVAGTQNYYIKSWFYKDNEFAAEVYRADRYDEEDESTWELYFGQTELGAVLNAFMWMSNQEEELKKSGQDYITLHKDDMDD